MRNNKKGEKKEKRKGKSRKHIKVAIEITVDKQEAIIFFELVSKNGQNMLFSLTHSHLKQSRPHTTLRFPHIPLQSSQSTVVIFYK